MNAVANAIALPEHPTIALPWFYPSAETERERQRILAARFFLVKIGGTGDVWRCKRCNQKHQFLTLMCVPQPFSGLSRGLFAYWKTVGAHQAAPHLPAAEQSRLRDLDRLFGPAAGRPDLASSHPETVRSLKIDERDADLGAYTFVAPKLDATALGVIEPIKRREAKRFARLINLRGVKPAFTLEGLRDG